MLMGTPLSGMLICIAQIRMSLGEMGERTLQKGIFERTEEEVQVNTFTFSALAIGKSVKCSHFCD